MKTHVNDEQNKLGYDENAYNRKENARCYGVQKMGKWKKVTQKHVSVDTICTIISVGFYHIPTTFSRHSHKNTTSISLEFDEKKRIRVLKNTN